jgi:hypothetical protein
MTKALARIALVVGVAAVALGATGGAATAQSASLAPGGAISASALGRFTLDITLMELHCTLELEGVRPTSAFEKLPGTQVGTITSAVGGDCDFGVTVTFLDLPWLLELDSIAGRLPAGITNWIEHLNSLKIRIDSGLIGSCLYDGVLTMDWWTTVPNVIERADVTATLPLARGGFLCATSADFYAEVEMTPEQTITRV